MKIVRLKFGVEKDNGGKYVLVIGPVPGFQQVV